MRRAAKIDLTQPEIVDACRLVGAKVIHIGYPFDLLVLYQGKILLWDCKVGHGKKGTIRKKPSQVKLEQDGWPIQYPRSADEALAALGVR